MELRFGHGISYRILVSLLVAAIPFVTIGVFMGLGSGQAQLRPIFGRHLGEIAERTAAGIDSYMFRQVIDATLLAKAPIIAGAAAAGSAAEAVPSETRDIDRLWRVERVPPPQVADIFDRPASRFLRDIAADDPIYRELLLTDRFGRLVAASGLTTDYDQADELWWSESFADGIAGRTIVGDVTWDESAEVFAVDIRVPVIDRTDDALVGIMRVIADSREMFAALTGAGASGIQATLIRRDGSVVFSERSADPTAVTFFAADLLREQLQALEEGDAGSAFVFSAGDSAGDRRLIAVAPCQLSTSYPSLPWLVAVSQSEAELFAPVTTQAITLLLILAVSAFVVLAVALWFSFRIAAPPQEEELEMHLVEHPRPPHLQEE